MPWLIALYVVAGLLESVGILLVVFDLRDVRNRLRTYRSAPAEVDLRAVVVGVRIGTPTIRLDPPPPLETRVQTLEMAIQQLREQHAEDVADLKDYARAEASEAIEHVQKSVSRDLTRLVDLVFALSDPDRRGWRRWWLGPVLLAAGLVLGVIGNVWSAW